MPQLLGSHIFSRTIPAETNILAGPIEYNMAVGYSSASTPRKLRLRTAGSSDGMYAGTSCKSVRDSSVNISVRSQQLLANSQRG